MKARIALIIVAALMGLALAGMVYRSNAIEAQRSRHIMELQAEARPYEVELESVRNELKDAENQFFTTHETARLALGLYAVEPEDITWAELQLEARGLSPVLVLDCASDRFSELLDAASGKDWEVMLTASPLTAETAAMILPAMEQVDASGVKRSDVFLLRNNDFSDEAVQAVGAAGFKGFTRYQNAANSGTTEDGLAWFSYIFYRSAQTNLGSWLASLVGNSGAMIITLDMEAIHSGELTEQNVKRFLDVVEQYSDEGDLQFSSTADILDDIARADLDKDDRQRLYDEYVAERRTRVDALEQTINGIYEQWDDVNTDNWLNVSMEQFHRKMERNWNIIKRMFKDIGERFRGRDAGK